MDRADIYKSIDGQKMVSQLHTDKGTETQTFLKSILPASIEKTKINNELNKRLMIYKSKKKAKEAPPRRLKTQLSQRERRRLGLYTLPRKGLQFSDYLPLNGLWRDYMKSYLNFRVIREKCVVGEQEHLQLLKADYHGAMVTVSRSRCPSLVGLTGILLMDTRNTLRIISKDNVVRTIPKEKSMFSITVEDLQFTIFGKHFQIKPNERSTKKIKNRSVSDL
ncbi:hypothetical protein B566_EDAN005591 [Ephemera danica]|nr:hypothetical protein B566_EDAN005591 [Ephemera danica]